ncbi:hypothetical protein HanIR_Chr05g0226741 [Helianthus annuus]|nr:hypothetical protein HanIR_Chr05g0226741 [Helianthus annuus]
MFEFTYELIIVAASNPHFIFLICNLIILILILVSLEPTSNSDHKQPPLPPLPAANKNNETATQTTRLQESAINVLIDVGPGSNDCKSSVKEPEDDELRRKVEEFIEKINRGWKAEKLSLAHGSLTS